MRGDSAARMEGGVPCLSIFLRQGLAQFFMLIFPYGRMEIPLGKRDKQSRL
jgi:hypothetical protein